MVETPPSPPLAGTESDLIGSSEMRSVEMGKDVKIDRDNGIPAEQELTRGEQRGEEHRQPIKENLLEIPDRCETDRMETEAPGDPPTPEILPHPENIVNMKGNNEPIAMKRLQNETEKDNVGGKWRRREGIKRNLR